MLVSGSTPVQIFKEIHSELYVRKDISQVAEEKAANGEVFAVPGVALQSYLHLHV